MTSLDVEDRNRLAVARKLSELGRYEDALVELGPVLASNPDDTEALCLAAQLGVKVSRWEDAERAARTAVRNAPSDAATWWTLAHVLQRRSFAPGGGKAIRLAARDASQHAAEIAPEAPGVLIQLAGINAELGTYQEALDILDQVIAKSSEHPGAWVMRGEVHRLHWRAFTPNQRNSAAARKIRNAGIDCYERALRVDPENVEAHRGLATLKAGKAEAIDHELTAGRLDPNKASGTRLVDLTLSSARTPSAWITLIHVACCAGVYIAISDTTNYRYVVTLNVIVGIVCLGLIVLGERITANRSASAPRTARHQAARRRERVGLWTDLTSICVVVGVTIALVNGQPSQGATTTTSPPTTNHAASGLPTTTCDPIGPIGIPAGPSLPGYSVPSPICIPTIQTSQSIPLPPYVDNSWLANHDDTDSEPTPTSGLIWCVTFTLVLLARMAGRRLAVLRTR